MYDLDQFSEEPIEFTVEFQGKTLTHYLKPVSIDEFFGAIKNVAKGTPAMRRTFREFLLDENQQPVSKEDIEKLLTKKGLIPLGLKINAAINSAMGLSELAEKNG